MMVSGIMKYTYPRTPVWFGHGGMLGLKPPPWWLGTWLTASSPRWTWPGSRSSLASPCFVWIPMFLLFLTVDFWESVAVHSLYKSHKLPNWGQNFHSIQTIFHSLQEKLCKIKIFRCFLQVITQHKPHFLHLCCISEHKIGNPNF